MPNKINVYKKFAKKTEEHTLKHYGVLGMHWGVRRYQDYGEGGYMPKTNPLSMNLQLFAVDRGKDVEPLRLPKSEWSHVMSEFETNVSESKKQAYNIIVHSVDSYDYTFAKNSDGDFDIIGKEYIPDAITGLLDRRFDDL